MLFCATVFYACTFVTFGSIIKVFLCLEVNEFGVPISELLALRKYCPFTNTLQDFYDSLHTNGGRLERSRTPKTQPLVITIHSNSSKLDDLAHQFDSTLDNISSKKKRNLAYDDDDDARSMDFDLKVDTWLERNEFRSASPPYSINDEFCNYDARKTRSVTKKILKAMAEAEESSQSQS